MEPVALTPAADCAAASAAVGAGAAAVPLASRIVVVRATTIMILTGLSAGAHDALKLRHKRLNLAHQAATTVAMAMGTANRLTALLVLIPMPAHVANVVALRSLRCLRGHRSRLRHRRHCLHSRTHWKARCCVRGLSGTSQLPLQPIPLEWGWGWAAADSMATATQQLHRLRALLLVAAARIGTLVVVRAALALAGTRLVLAPWL